MFLQASDDLGSKGDFGKQVEYPFALPDHFFDQPDIDQGFPTGGNSVQADFLFPGSRRTASSGLLNGAQFKINPDVPGIQG